MLEIARFQARRRLKGTIGLSLAIVVLVAFYIGLWPSMADLELEELFENLPEFFQDMFGIIALDTIEGFLAAELYQFIWTLLLGLYFGYVAAGVIAGDFERNRLDITLSLPVTRTRLLLEEFVALLVPVVIVNAVVALAVVGGLILIGEWIDLSSLALVHLLSIPYFAVCLGIGLVFSVWFDRADIAQRLAIGVVFVLWVVDSVSKTVDREWLGFLSPSRYYSPSEILVLETVEWVDAVVLIAMTLGLVAAAVLLFKRKDLAA